MHVMRMLVLVSTLCWVYLACDCDSHVGLLSSIGLVRIVVDLPGRAYAKRSEMASIVGLR